MSIRVMTAVWDSPCEDPSTLLLLLALADWANDQGECWPSVANLATKARMSVRNCQLHLRRLEKIGVIDCLPGNGRTHTNHYFLNLQTLQSMQALLHPLQGFYRERVQVATLKGASIVAPEPSVDPSKERSPSVVPKRHTQYSDAFETFWKTYPRKRNKATAWQVWTKEGCEAQAPRIVQSIHDHITYDSQWQRNGGEFIPHPATYLHNERWTDDLEIPHGKPHTRISL